MKGRSKKREANGRQGKRNKRGRRQAKQEDSKENTGKLVQERRIERRKVKQVARREGRRE